jgi:hypothetical protein
MSEPTPIRMPRATEVVRDGVDASQRMLEELKACAEWIKKASALLDRCWVALPVNSPLHRDIRAFVMRLKP